MSQACIDGTAPIPYKRSPLSRTLDKLNGLAMTQPSPSPSDDSSHPQGSTETVAETHATDTPCDKCLTSSCVCASSVPPRLQNEPSVEATSKAMYHDIAGLTLRDDVLALLERKGAIYSARRAAAASHFRISAAEARAMISVSGFPDNGFVEPEPEPTVPSAPTPPRHRRLAAELTVPSVPRAESP